MLKKSFWIVPRSILTQPDNEDAYVLQRALIAHMTLFNGAAVILDSDFVQNPVMRGALRRGDSFFIEAFERGLIRLAVRSRGAGLVPLAKTVESVAQGGGLFAGTPLGDAPEFHIAEAASPEPYHLDEAASRYRSEVTKLFATAAIGPDQLRPGLLEAIRASVAVHASQDPHFGWGFFEANSALWSEAEKHAQLAPTAAEKKFTWDLARGPYVTFIPDHLKIGAAYSKEDALGVEFWRGRFNVDVQDRRTLSTKVGGGDLADLVRGLAALPVQDIVALIEAGQDFERSSNEAKGDEALRALGGVDS